MKPTTLSILMSVLALLSFVAPAWYFSNNGPDGETEKKPLFTLARNKSPAMDAHSITPFSKAPPTINSATGSWTGAVRIGTDAPVVFMFTLREEHGILRGSASFPIGEGPVEDGKVTGNKLAFFTRHRLASPGQILTIRFTGEIVEGVMALQMRSEGVDSALTLNRMSY